ncbi:hypothetical protein TNCT_131241 [Trichonephila clavata]|uniref:Uncharacterized protein n=1 Tax=Trichonephila clavata TaxID=2740835 RepID=A0A8X6KV35_TRICU|nr:hypothetical protein TNCT_131241 [Trichonephila clavata]
MIRGYHVWYSNIPFDELGDRLGRRYDEGDLKRRFRNRPLVGLGVERGRKFGLRAPSSASISSKLCR